MSETSAEIAGAKSDQPRAGKRYLKVRYILQALRKRKGRLLIAFVILLLVFSAFALLQHLFVRKQVYQTTVKELRAWAEQIADEIGYKARWDLRGYRQATITVPMWYVLASDGVIIDIEGFTPEIFDGVTPPDDAIFTAPINKSTIFNENWRLLGKKLKDGYVVVGVSSSDFAADTDAKLQENAAKFGTTVAEAISVRSRDIDGVVDYAVVSSEGELKAAEGGVPLRIDVAKLPKPADHVARLLVKGKHYLLYFRPIGRSTDNQSVGTIIVPRDMSLVEQSSRTQDRFNLWAIGVTAAFAGAIAFWLIVSELLTQTRRVNLADALRIGETRTIEFKSTFQWDIRLSQYVEQRRLDVLKSIAGFLNAQGGTLFIGISEDTNPPSLRGLEEDLRYVGGSRDKLQRTLRDLITTRIGPEFSPLIADGLEDENGTPYWVVVVEESPEPAFVRWKFAGEAKDQKKFYVREGPKTTDLDSERTWHYIKNKWG